MEEANNGIERTHSGMSMAGQRWGKSGRLSYIVCITITRTFPPQGKSHTISNKNGGNAAHVYYVIYMQSDMVTTIHYTQTGGDESVGTHANMEEKKI